MIMNLKKIKKICSCLILVTVFSLTSLCDVVFASTTTEDSEEGIFDFLTKGESNGAFDKITQTAKETGASGYKFMMVVGAIGLVFSVVTLGISIALTKNSAKRSESKDHIKYIALGAMLVFGAIALIGLVQSVATKI